VLVLTAEKRVLSRDLRSALVTLRCQGRLHGFIVDECRCVASWGRGFRPAYGRIGEVIPDVEAHVELRTQRL